MYERTYHKRVLHTDSEEPKKRGKQKQRTVNWKRVMRIAIGVAIITGLVFLVRLPNVQVRHVEVVGANVVYPGDVSEFVTTQLQGRKLFVLPRSSIFLIPTHTIEKELKAAFPRLQTVAVNRKNFSTLVVTVKEYQGVYLWCSDEATCYFMDQNGVAFTAAPYFSGNAYPKIFSGTLQPLPFQALTAEQISTVGLLIDRLTTLGIAPSEFHYIGDHELDVSFVHNSQPASLMFDPSMDINDALTALYTGLRTDPLATEFHDTAKVLQYIDLRFANRVVYKFQ
ncbi:MAG: hypothetical protein JWM92_239 [Candidatus Nomurabacteria bacterium]|jgi:hypothetical protein|nr:hypothetical protein [Candidatus Nomurabacteria bacterium]